MTVTLNKLLFYTLAILLELFFKLRQDKKISLSLLFNTNFRIRLSIAHTKKYPAEMLMGIKLNLSTWGKISLIDWVFLRICQVTPDYWDFFKRKWLIKYIFHHYIKDFAQNLSVSFMIKFHVSVIRKYFNLNV